MTSSSSVETIPPWATPSQPWKRGSRVISVQQPSGVTCRSSFRPCSLSSPQAKQRWGSNRKPGSASDVKVLDLACLGFDEVLPRRDLLAHEHREDRVGGGRVLD